MIIRYLFHVAVDLSDMILWRVSGFTSMTGSAYMIYSPPRCLLHTIDRWTLQTVSTENPSIENSYI